MSMISLTFFFRYNRGHSVCALLTPARYGGEFQDFRHHECEFFGARLNRLIWVPCSLRSVELHSRGRCWGKKRRLQRRSPPGRTPSSTWPVFYLLSLPRWEGMATFTTPWRKVGLLDARGCRCPLLLKRNFLTSVSINRWKGNFLKLCGWIIFVVLIYRYRD